MFVFFLAQDHGSPFLPNLHYKSRNHTFLLLVFWHFFVGHCEAALYLTSTSHGNQDPLHAASSFYYYYDPKSFATSSYYYEPKSSPSHLFPRKNGTKELPEVRETNNSLNKQEDNIIIIKDPLFGQLKSRASLEDIYYDDDDSIIDEEDFLLKSFYQDENENVPFLDRNFFGKKTASQKSVKKSNQSVKIGSPNQNNTKKTQNIVEVKRNHSEVKHVENVAINNRGSSKLDFGENFNLSSGKLDPGKNTVWNTGKVNLDEPVVYNQASTTSAPFVYSTRKSRGDETSAESQGIQKGEYRNQVNLVAQESSIGPKVLPTQIVTVNPLPTALPVVAVTTDATSIPGMPGIDYPVFGEIPVTGFHCSDQRYKGFFADVETKCQVSFLYEFSSLEISFIID